MRSSHTCPRISISVHEITTKKPTFLRNFSAVLHILPLCRPLTHISLLQDNL